MKTEPKPFASLSSGLLARKGAARPAMRPQGFGQSGAGLEDLGWNDMGFEAPKAVPAERDGEHDAFGEEIVEHPRSAHPTGLSPVESPVHGQQAEIADRFSAAADEEEAFDEEYDETAEPYDPNALEGDEDEDEEEADEEALYAEPQAPVFVAPQPVFEAPEPVFEAPKPVTFEAPVPVSAQAPAPRRVPVSRSVPGAKEKAAFTLRLDKDRHLKLRLACAVNGRSAQMLVTEALDQLLRAMPEVDDMAEKANRKG